MVFPRKKSTDLPRRRQMSDASTRVADKSLEERYAFRRNRTITGSASSTVTTVNEAGSQLKSSRVHAHNLTAQRRKIGAILGVVLLGITTLYILLTQFTATIYVRSHDTGLELDRSYEAAIQGYFGSMPIQRLRFLMNTNELLSSVQKNHPEVAAIAIEGSAGIGKTSLVVTFRKPIVSWSVGGVKEYVDATGTAFQKNYYSEPSVQIIDKSGIPASSGQAVASNRFLGYVGRLVGLMKQYGYDTVNVTIPVGTSRQVQLQLKDVLSPVIVSIDRPAGEQAEDASRAIVWFKNHDQTPEYIDVRVSGKAYYR